MMATRARDSQRGVVGILHPGEMGVAVARQLLLAGHRVLWASEGRGHESRRRARAAGLEDAGTVAEVCAQASVIFSICPPHAALEVAGEVAGLLGPPMGAASGPRVRLVDANAVAPATSRAVRERIESAGGAFTDGSIVGPPPAGSATARLYLSGAGAHEVAALFDGTDVAARVVEGGDHAASALKMAYAGWTKVAAALLLSVRDLARTEGVEAALLAEWDESVPGLAGRADAAAAAAAAKGWRWAGEMREIAAAMAAAGLPDGFALAAAERYDAVERPRAAATEPPSGAERPTA